MGAFKTLDTALRELIATYSRAAVVATLALLTTCECKRCGYTWTPRHADTPTQCPACKSRYWQTERRATRAA